MGGYGSSKEQGLSLDGVFAKLAISRYMMNGSTNTASAKSKYSYCSPADRTHQGLPAQLQMSFTVPVKILSGTTGTRLTALECCLTRLPFWGMQCSAVDYTALEMASPVGRKYMT